MGQLRLVLRRASTHDYGAVCSLREAASRWLRTKATDQWEKPWPNEAARNLRVWAAIQAGRTWVAWDETVAAATITVSPNHHAIWPEENRRDMAVYVRRLVVGRPYSRRGLGGQLLDWAGLRAAREYGARWIRVDVWTTNTRLHEYYMDQGFEFCGFCETVSDYPSAALFQKQTDQVKLLTARCSRSTPALYDMLRAGDQALPRAEHRAGAHGDRAGGEQDLAQRVGQGRGLAGEVGGDQERA
jgi:GNAT superfamily N-acetyltransferase